MDQGLHDRIEAAIEDGADVGALVDMLPDSTLALVAGACRDSRRTLAAMASRFPGVSDALAAPAEELGLALRVVELAMRDRVQAARRAAHPHGQFDGACGDGKRP